MNGARALSAAVTMALVGWLAGCASSSSSTAPSASQPSIAADVIIDVVQAEDGTCSLSLPYTPLDVGQKVKWQGKDKNGNKRVVWVTRVINDPGTGNLENNNPKGWALSKAAKTKGKDPGWYCYDVALRKGGESICTIDPEICIRGQQNCPSALARKVSTDDKCAGG